MAMEKRHVRCGCARTIQLSNCAQNGISPCTSFASPSGRGRAARDGRHPRPSSTAAYRTDPPMHSNGANRRRFARAIFPANGDAERSDFLLSDRLHLRVAADKSGQRRTGFWFSGCVWCVVPHLRFCCSLEGVWGRFPPCPLSLTLSAKGGKQTGRRHSSAHKSSSIVFPKLFQTCNLTPSPPQLDSRHAADPPG